MSISKTRSQTLLARLPAARISLVALLTALAVAASALEQSMAQSAVPDDRTYLTGYRAHLDRYDDAWAAMVGAQRQVDAAAKVLRETEVAFDKAEYALHQRHMEYHAASSASRREALFPAYSRARSEYYRAAERMRQANDRVREAQSTFQTAESEWKRLGVVLAQYKVDAGRERSFRESVEFCQEYGCAPGHPVRRNGSLPRAPAGRAPHDQRGCRLRCGADRQGRFESGSRTTRATFSLENSKAGSTSRLPHA